MFFTDNAGNRGIVFELLEADDMRTRQLDTLLDLDGLNRTIIDRAYHRDLSLERENYGARMSGMFTPVRDGTYAFVALGDDDFAVYTTADGSPDGGLVCRDFDQVWFIIMIDCCSINLKG